MIVLNGTRAEDTQLASARKAVTSPVIDTQRLFWSTHGNVPVPIMGKILNIRDSGDKKRAESKAQ